MSEGDVTTRQHPRYATDVAVTVRIGDRVIEGRTRNVSRGGLSALVSVPVEPGATGEMSLALVFDADTASEPLVLPARIVWCTELGVDNHQLGAAFIGITPEQTKYLEMFLRYLVDTAGDTNA